MEDMMRPSLKRGTVGAPSAKLREVSSNELPPVAGVTGAEAEPW